MALPANIGQVPTDKLAQTQKISRKKKKKTIHAMTEHGNMSVNCLAPTVIVLPPSPQNM